MHVHVHCTVHVHVYMCSCVLPVHVCLLRPSSSVLGQAGSTEIYRSKEVFQVQCTMHAQYTPVHVHIYSTYRVILRIVKAGCRPVAHSSGGTALTAKVRGPRFNPRWLPVFHSSLKIFPSLFIMYMYMYTCTCTGMLYCVTFTCTCIV